jgi:tetratricopeptide (TPR) repeat protein
MSVDFPAEELPLDFEKLIEDAVKVALREQDATRFLAWMRGSIYDYSTLGDPRHDDLFEARAADHHELLRSLGMILGRHMWNAIPLPANRYHPAPLPQPHGNDPCICGSGRKYKQCCAQLPPMPPLTPNDLWPLVLEHLSPGQRLEAYGAKAVPVEVLGVQASDLLDQGHPGKARQLLEPLFDPELGGTDEAYDFALNVLCNIYDRLSFRNKKERLLGRIIREAPRSALSSGAWQRLAAIRMDRGDSDGAWEAFRRAQRDDPDTTSLGVLEIQLLLSENRASQARERARMWLRKIHRADLEDDTLTEFFEAVASDPHAAMVEIGMEMSGGAGAELLTLLQDLALRPLPAYGLKPVPARGRSPSRTRILETPKELRQLEAAWSDVFPRDGLVAVSGALATVSEQTPWDSEIEMQWTDWLREKPVAMDSIAILDDLASALLEHPQASIPGWDERMLAPVLDRQCAILENSLEPGGTRLDSHREENQPALRGLLRRLESSLRHDEHQAMERDARLLLQLDPRDDQGVRLLIMDDLLRSGRDADALALAEGYADDDEPDLPFGAALASFRQGDPARAERLLSRAMSEFPLVVPMLLKKSTRIPRAHDDTGPGSVGQAWYYRESALDLWQGTPQALEWLRAARQPE